MMNNEAIRPNAERLAAQTTNKLPVDKERIAKASAILQKYKEGKANLEKRIIDNEQWYKLRHWECMRDKKSDVQPVSGWLFNSIANKHADAMDNFPSPNILPREEGDKAEAEKLTSILPVVLDQCDFEQVYSDVWDYKLKSGTGVYGVFWDKSKLGGLGDIAIEKIDLINLFWESGITDIQRSRNLFHVELMDNELLEQIYPQLKGKLGGRLVDVKEYVYDDKVDTAEKSTVVDWYYKKNIGGKTTVHYCKYVGDEVIFATENETTPVVDNEGRIIKPAMAQTGLYEHGKYPFIFDPLYRTEGTPTGFGFIDVGKDAQAYIDRANQAIMKNMMHNANPRYVASKNCGINLDDFADPTKEIIEAAGSLNEDNVLPLTTKPLNSIYLNVLDSKINELKEVTGNRDISTGGTAGGVTAASAIAAMQEAGSKLSRDNNKASYRAYKRLCLMIIELIRQFYDLPRCFRIMGQNGMAKYINYTNQNIKQQQQLGPIGEDMGYRLPLFDIEVTAQKASPYSKLSQNELALQFLNAGFFEPQRADQSLACLEMMDFDRKSFVMQKIQLNGTMYQQLMAMQQQMMQLAVMVDHYRGSNEVSSSLAAQFGMQVHAEATIKKIEPSKVQNSEALGGEGKSETKVTKNARKRVANATAPN